jgi:RHS repeat-associated protein
VVYDRQADGSYARTWLQADPGSRPGQAQRGSVVLSTNDLGAPVQTLTYGPFGEPNTLLGTPWRYTGQRLDQDTGLYHYKARWYSPWMGRLLFGHTATHNQPSTAKHKTNGRSIFLAA